MFVSRPCSIFRVCEHASDWMQAWGHVLGEGEALQGNVRVVTSKCSRKKLRILEQWLFSCFQLGSIRIIKSPSLWGHRDHEANAESGSFSSARISFRLERESYVLGRLCAFSQAFKTCNASQSLKTVQNGLLPYSSLEVVPPSFHLEAEARVLLEIAAACWDVILTVVQ